MSKEKMIARDFLNMPSNASQIERTRRGDGEGNSKSQSENSNSNSNEESEPKRRRFHRHTPEQIQEMEAFFKNCPNPDERQRMELSEQLGMEPMQVKFWFQNKRTQMKTQHEHKENNQLRTENEKLRAENLRFKEALDNVSCHHCAGVTNTARETSFHGTQLRLENSRLRQEIGRISSGSTKYNGRIDVGTSSKTPSNSTPYISLGSSMHHRGNNDRNRSVVVDLAMSAMEELMRVAQLGEPLWVPSMDQNAFELNTNEYLRAYSRVFKQKMNGFKLEASRENVIVPMNAANVVEIIMDVEQWANVFSGLVSRAENLQVISSGLRGTYNEAVLVMKAEFQISSLLVPTRESYFLRYCKRHVDGIWAVVDVSLDHLHTTSLVTCRRRPSGCLIQDVPSGHSKVTWVEHVEVEDGGIHNIYKPLIASGLAFGAKRWVAILEGYCQRHTFSNRLPSETANNFLAENQDGRRGMLKLAEKMVTRFCRNVNTSIVNKWTALSRNGNESMKFTTRTNVDDPSLPVGVMLCIATSFWLPTTPKRVFQFLSDSNTRKVWDMLLNGGDIEEMTHVVSGKGELNRVTLYQVKGAESSSNQMVILQESRSDPTASYVVYAPIAMVSAKTVLDGEDPTKVALLPSGFAILPDGPIGRGQGRGMPANTDTGGSLLTVALQILIDSTPNANIPMGSVDIASKLMWNTAEKIKQALLSRS